MRNIFYKSIFAGGLLCLSAMLIQAQVYTLEKTATAGGGVSGGTGGNYSLSAMTGQAAAGNALGGGSYAMTTGFWSYSPLAPTAASASISGRVLTADGQGIRNVRVVLTNGAGESRIAQTGSFGYFRFAEVPVGTTYVLTVYSKRFTFAQPSRVILLYEDLTDVDFISEP